MQFKFAFDTVLRMYKYGSAIILGSGRSGCAAEALLRSENTRVAVISDDTTPDYKYEDISFEPEIAIVSPGFSLSHPWVQDLRKRNIKFLSELELGWSRRKCPVVAVTGSNGKSTVVKWLVDAFEQAGKHAVACGNYGVPVSEVVMREDDFDWLVVEVSSFQMETSDNFKPDIGIVLNILPNHLDRHGSMDAYRELKMKIFEYMDFEDTAILPVDLLKYAKTSAKIVSFGIEDDANFVFKNGFVGDVDLYESYFDNDILGASAAAVVATGRACGIPKSSIEASAKDFIPLPHRMETVCKVNGIRFIDDSKATNLAGMCAALRMCRGKIHLIAGGRAKEKDFSFVKDFLVKRVLHLYLIGEASESMYAAWSDCVDCLLCEELRRAVLSAWENAEPGDTVLLSPACTSFDQFKSFGERGEVFVSEVRRLEAGCEQAQRDVREKMKEV